MVRLLYVRRDSDDEAIRCHVLNFTAEYNILSEKRKTSGAKRHRNEDKLWI